jgi:hypothetical protein
MSLSVCPEHFVGGREMIRECRRLLLTVGDLHRLGYEQARIRPFITDTAGGIDWHCIVAPASSSGDESRSAYFIGRGWSLYEFYHNAEAFLACSPELAPRWLGSDPLYAQWYRDMLRATEPGGLVYFGAWWDYHQPPPADSVRGFTAEGAQILLPLPPPPPS